MSPKQTKNKITGMLEKFLEPVIVAKLDNKTLNLTWNKKARRWE
jgi:hypothetical protein